MTDVNAIDANELVGSASQVMTDTTMQRATEIVYDLQHLDWNNLGSVAMTVLQATFSFVSLGIPAIILLAIEVFAVKYFIFNRLNLPEFLRWIAAFLITMAFLLPLTATFLLPIITNVFNGISTGG